jgi:hypothetical protein
MLLVVGVAPGNFPCRALFLWFETDTGEVLAHLSINFQQFFQGSAPTINQTRRVQTQYQC